MGSPLTPVLANIFMGFYKCKWLNGYNVNKPKLYLRYADDILAAFGKEQDSLDFLNFLNKKHPNIKLTKSKFTITLLSLMYSFQVSIIEISQFKRQKSTYTEPVLNYKNFASFLYKIGLNNCLIDKSFKICNNWNSFHNDIESIKFNLI